MSFSVDELARIAIDLQSDIGHTDRFSRLITTLRQILGCDASALLRYEAHQFVPLAIDGLAQDVLGRRFALEGHPRLEAIARAGDVVRFPADSDLPDPYDGLIPGHESLKVHACIDHGVTEGAALRFAAVAAGIAIFIAAGNRQKRNVNGNFALLNQMHPPTVGMDLYRLVHQTGRNCIRQITTHPGGIDFADHAITNVFNKRGIA